MLQDGSRTKNVYDEQGQTTMRVINKCRGVHMAATVLVVVAGLCRFTLGQEGSVPKDSLSPHVKLRSVSLKDVGWTDGLLPGGFSAKHRHLHRVAFRPGNIEVEPFSTALEFTPDPFKIGPHP